MIQISVTSVYLGPIPGSAPGLFDHWKFTTESTTDNTCIFDFTRNTYMYL